jgi:hypothetical protein
MAKGHKKTPEIVGEGGEPAPKPLPPQAWEPLVHQQEDQRDSPASEEGQSITLGRGAMRLWGMQFANQYLEGPFNRAMATGPAVMTRLAGCSGQCSASELPLRG